MKIYLLDIKPEICQSWRNEFRDIDECNVEIVKDNFIYFTRSHKDIDGIQPIATCISTITGEINKLGKPIYLLHTPIMTTPSEVSDQINLPDKVINWNEAYEIDKILRK